MDWLPTEQLIALDRQHVWHPYAPMPNPGPVFPVRSAQGVYLELETGERLVDGMSSWWTAIHGYNHPRLNRAAQAQIERMSHVMFGGLTHQPAVQLAQRLVEALGHVGDLQPVLDLPVSLLKVGIVCVIDMFLLDGAHEAVGQADLSGLPILTRIGWGNTSR